MFLARAMKKVHPEIGFKEINRNPIESTSMSNARLVDSSREKRKEKKKKTKAKAKGKNERSCAYLM